MGISCSVIIYIVDMAEVGKGLYISGLSRVIILSYGKLEKMNFR